MNAIILAAGMGRRMQPMGWDLPKCLLPCPGGTLLDNTLNALGNRGVSRVAIVVGYRREQVEAAAGKHGLPIEFVVNEDYATTNTLRSLYLAREHLSEGALLFNGDVWFRRTVLEHILPSQATAATRQMHEGEPRATPLPPRERGRGEGGEASALLVVKHACFAEEVKVVANTAQRITAIGKDLDCAAAAGEFVGIARFDPSAGSALARSLETSVAAGHSNRFYEYSLNQILDQHPVRAAFIELMDAIEIDTPEDYTAAECLWSIR
jgi:choline kinase